MLSDRVSRHAGGDGLDPCFTAKIAKLAKMENCFVTTKPTKGTKDAEEVAQQVVDAALKVHRALGPGLLESAYEHCLAFELGQRGVGVERQKCVPIIYEGLRIEAGYRIDLLVADQIVIELKAVDRLEPIHEAQLLAYLKLAKRRIGFLINFNVRLLKDGIRRRVL